MREKRTSLDEYLASESNFLRMYYEHMVRSFSEESILSYSKNLAGTVLEAVSESGFGNFCSNVRSFFIENKSSQIESFVGRSCIDESLFDMKPKDRLLLLLQPYIAVNNAMRNYSIRGNKENLSIKEVLYYSSKESPYAFKLRIGNSLFENCFFLKWYNPLRVLALILMNQIGIGYSFHYHPKGQEYIIPELKSKSEILEKRNREIREYQKKAKDIKRKVYTVIENYVEDLFYATQTDLYDKEEILPQIGFVAHFCHAFSIEDVIANPQNIVYNYDGGVLTSYMIDSADMFSANNGFSIKEEIAKLLRTCSFYTEENVDFAINQGKKLMKRLVKRNQENLLSFANDLKAKNVHYVREDMHGKVYINIADQVNRFISNFG